MDTYTLSMVAFTLDGQSWAVMTEIVQPKWPKIVTIWPFTEKVCTPVLDQQGCLLPASWFSFLHEKWASLPHFLHLLSSLMVLTSPFFINRMSLDFTKHIFVVFLYFIYSQNYNNNNLKFIFHKLKFQQTSKTFKGSFSISLLPLLQVSNFRGTAIYSKGHRLADYPKCH